MDTGMVPGEIGIILEHREVIGTPGEVYGPYWALVERGEKVQKVACASPLPKPYWTSGGGAAPLSFFLSLSFLLSYSE